MPHFSQQIIWIAPHPPLDMSGWGFVMSRLTQGHHWLGKRLADLIKHEGEAPWGRVYIGVLRGSEQTTGSPPNGWGDWEGRRLQSSYGTPTSCYPGEDEVLLSIEVHKKCQGELNPAKLLLPIDPTAKTPSPVLAWHITLLCPTPLLLKPLFAPVFTLFPKPVPFFAPSLVFSRWPGQPWGWIIPFRQSCPRKLLRKLPPQKA